MCACKWNQWSFSCSLRSIHGSSKQNDFQLNHKQRHSSVTWNVFSSECFVFILAQTAFKWENILKYSIFFLKFKFVYRSECLCMCVRNLFSGIGHRVHALGISHFFFLSSFLLIEASFGIWIRSFYVREAFKIPLNNSFE